MKKKIKFQVLLLVLALIFTLSVPALANYSIVENTNATISEEDSDIDWLQVFELAKWVLHKVGQAFTVETAGGVSSGDGWCEKNSGMLDFGEDDDQVLSTQLTANLEVENSAMWAFVYAGILGSRTKTLTLMAEYPDGTYVYDANGQWGGHVSHNQIISFFPDADDPRGDYQIHFVDDKEEQKFNCYVKCWEYTPDSRGLVATSTTNCNEPPQNLMTINGAEIRYDSNAGMQFIVPSKQFASEISTYSSNEVLDGDELTAQFYDAVYDLYVDNLKNYDIGDTINFCDEIISIEYNEEKSMTELTFPCDAGNIYWQFSGDLRDRYSIGDLVNLTFTVEKAGESNGIIFESLNYILDNYTLREKGSYPSIDDYITHNVIMQ